MNITKKLVEKIADLIKIYILQDEIELYRRQLETALKPMEVLKDLDTENTPETSHTVGSKNIFRKDEAQSSLTQQEVLKNAKYTSDGFIVVKRVINGS